MTIWLGVLSAVLALAVILLIWKTALMRKAADELSRDLAEKLAGDTNTLIDLSTGDRHMRRLAAELNCQLRVLRQERRRYQQGDRELKEALTNISHDLRTPLTAISGYLDLLEREEKPETVTRYLAMIRNRTQVMRQLTEELLRYSVVASLPGFTLERLCLNDVLAESLAAFYGALKERGVTPEISMPDQPVERVLDRGALGRIFSNVLGNAVKYSGGDLSVILKEDGEITFSNTAEALDYCMAGKLFDRFYTVETGRDSTGLGLSIARLLTEQLGGTIGADYADGRLLVKVRFPET